MGIAYGIGGIIKVPAAPVKGRGVPPASYKAELGQMYFDESVSPPDLYIYNGSTWEIGGDSEATTSKEGVVEIATLAELQAGTAPAGAVVPLANDVFTVIQGIVVGAVPAATETTSGIAEIATQVETDAGTDDTRIVTPLKLANFIGASGVPGSFTDLTATGAVSFTGATGGLTMTSATASSLGVTGAGIDLTLDSAGGRVVVNGEEAADDALRLVSSAGGLDVDVALQMSLVSSENAADAIVINASAGGIDITAAGAAGEDIDIVNTAGSVNITAGESGTDAIVLSASIGGIQINAPGASAGEDIAITATGSSVRIVSTENVSDSIVLSSTNGGIDILAPGAAPGEDIDIIATGSSVNIESTENAALAVYLHANGGTSETIRLRSDQGTGAASIDLLSDVGGITLTSGLASADAINLVTSDAGGGIDVDAGTAGFIVDTTGGISLDAAANSNFTATGAFDITIQSTAGSILLNAGEAVTDAINIDSTGGFDLNAALEINIDSSEAAVADAVRIVASAADGGIDIDSGTGGLTLDTTGAMSLDAAAASNFSVSGAGIDLSLVSAAGRVIVNAEEAAANAITLLSAAGGIDADAALQINIATSQDAADALVLNASAGGIDITAAGAAGEDIDIVNTAGSINLTAGENVANSMVFTNTGMDIVITGAAGQDFDLTNTGGSVNITATESVTDALNLTASGAAGGLNLTAGTNGILLSSGQKVKVTAVVTGVDASPYALLGTDYFVAVDTGAGVMTITLPASPATGRKVTIYDAGGAAAGSNITIDGNGNNIAAAGTVAATKLINTAYESYNLVFDGTLWLGQNIV